MKKLLLTIFFLGVISFIYAYESKSIIIEHIGESNGPREKIIINTRYAGTLAEYPSFYLLYYFRLNEYAFAEIIDLILNNEELFGEREWISERNIFRLTENGTYRLDIENGDEVYSLYLVNRNSSIIFFRILIELLETIYPRYELINKLKMLPDIFRDL